MAEPLSIVTGVASLVTVCAKISQSLNTLKGKFQSAHLTIASLSVECSTTTLALSHLEQALRNNPELIGGSSNSRDDVITCFELGIGGIATVFSVLDDELSRLKTGTSMVNKVAFRDKARYTWNEALIKELAQQIRDQRSSISFLLSCVQMNRNFVGGTPPVISPAADKILRDNLTRARSLRSQCSRSTLRGAYANDMDEILERTSIHESYEATLLQSQPYVRVRDGHPPINTEHEVSLRNNESCSNSTTIQQSNAHMIIQDISSLNLPDENVTGQERTGTVPGGMREEPICVPIQGATPPTSTNLNDFSVSGGALEDHAMSQSDSRWIDYGAPPLNDANSEAVVNPHIYNPSVSSLSTNIELHVAIANGNNSTIESLLQAGADINNIFGGYSPLGRAVEENHTKGVELLLKHDADLEAYALHSIGYTALHLATSGNRVEIITVLLQAGSDKSRQTPQDLETALFIACKKGLFSLTSLLLEGGGDSVLETPNHEGRTPLLEATSHGFTEITEVLLQAGANVHYKDTNGWTALHIAAKEGHFEIAKLLVKFGSELDAKDMFDDWAPLHHAIWSQRSETIKFLLDSEASFDATDHKGRTPLMLAAENDDTSTMKLLLVEGADINLSDVDGWTAIHVAACYGSIKATKILLSEGIDAEKTTNDGFAPLILAAKEGHVEVVKLLLQANVQVDYCGGKQGTALHRAAFHGHVEVCEILLEHGATVDSRVLGISPLMCAARKNHTAVVKLLLSRGADVNAHNQDGHSALLSAAEVGHTHLVEVLLDAGATIDVKTKRGETPLHNAADQSHYAVVELLLQRGADRSSIGIAV